MYRYADYTSTNREKIFGFGHCKMKTQKDPESHPGDLRTPPYHPHLPQGENRTGSY